jgi:hypothetical protein
MCTISRQVVLQYLRGEIDGADKVKIASVTLGQNTRRLATKGAMLQIQLAVLRHVSDNKEQFKEYLRASQPQLLPDK